MYPGLSDADCRAAERRFRDLRVEATRQRVEREAIATGNGKFALFAAMRRIALEALVRVWAP